MPLPSRVRIDIELIDPFVYQHHQSYDFTLTTYDPDLRGR